MYTFTDSHVLQVPVDPMQFFCSDLQTFRQKERKKIHSHGLEESLLSSFQPVMQCSNLSIHGPFLATTLSSQGILHLANS